MSMIVQFISLRKKIQNLLLEHKKPILQKNIISKQLLSNNITHKTDFIVSQNKQKRCKKLLLWYFC